MLIYTLKINNKLPMFETTACTLTSAKSGISLFLTPTAWTTRIVLFTRTS